MFHRVMAMTAMSHRRHAPFNETADGIDADDVIEPSISTQTITIEISSIDAGIVSFCSTSPYRRR